jgi:hypothetical protein
MARNSDHVRLNASWPVTGAMFGSMRTASGAYPARIASTFRVATVRIISALLARISVSVSIGFTTTAGAQAVASAKVAISAACLL